jgi:kumamolisin
MKRSVFLLIRGSVIIALSVSGFAQDQSSPARGTIVVPLSTVVGGAERFQTSMYIFIPDDKAPIPNGETPASIACIYGVTAPTNGCPKNGTLLPNGGAKAIAVVSYGVNSFLQSDMDTFNAHFGLPGVTISKICSCASCPDNSGTGFDIETALDVEWAHAMAPHAQIILSSFCSDPFQEIPGAETLAGQAVAGAGGGEVSNGFSYLGEFSGELGYDQYMQVPSVVYFSEAGNSGGPSYPSVSPYSVSVGGTTIIRDSNGNFTGEEDCWSSSGGGISQYESLPLYQNILRNISSTHRITPDVSADANPASGVLVYSTTGCGGWCVVGGTSVSSPVLAGITNAAGSFLNSTSAELTKTYGEYRLPGIYHKYFFDVVQGAKFGYDQCTGIGSPRDLAGL